MTVAIQHQYLINDETGKILIAGYLDLSDSVKPGYSLIIDKLPLGAEFEELKKFAIGSGLCDYIREEAIKLIQSKEDQLNLLIKFSPFLELLKGSQYNTMTKDDFDELIQLFDKRYVSDPEEYDEINQTILNLAKGWQPLVQFFDKS